MNGDRRSGLRAGRRTVPAECWTEVIGRMNAEDKKTLVRGYYQQELNQGNLSLADGLLAPGFISHSPLGGTENGDQYKKAISESRSAFPDLEVVVEDQIAEAEKVVTRWSARGIHSGPFTGILPIGNRVTIADIHIHRVADGQIVELWEQVDTLGMLQQLGLIPAGQGCND